MTKIIPIILLCVIVILSYGIYDISLINENLSQQCDYIMDTLNYFMDKDDTIIKEIQEYNREPITT